MSTEERAVLGDELQQRGDPQGELIALQLALEALPADATPARRNAIARRIAAHLDEHHDALYGSLAPHVTRLSLPDLRDPALEVRQWRGGFAETVWLQTTAAGPTLVDVLGALRELPIARDVRRLEVGQGDHPGFVAQLLRQPIPALRELVLGDRSRWMHDLQHTDLGHTRALEPLVEGLEIVRILQPIVYTPLASSTVRVLAVSHRGHDLFGPPTSAFEGRLPALEELVANGFLADNNLFDRHPRLRHLSLYGAYEDGWLEHLIRSRHLERMQVLQLGYQLTDADLDTLITLAQRLAHLELLDLRANAFTVDAIAAAQARLPPCVRLR